MVFLDVEKYFNKNVVILLGGCLTGGQSEEAYRHKSGTI